MGAACDAAIAIGWLRSLRSNPIYHLGVADAGYSTTATSAVRAMGAGAGCEGNGGSIVAHGVETVLVYG